MTNSIGRRDLFRAGGRKVAAIASEIAAARTKGRAEGWIRPPYAVDELNFLLSCTRCDKCIEACPHDVLFKLPAAAGTRAAGTPVMNLLRHGCHMCDDWPCVVACEPDALILPQEDGNRPPPPILAKAEIDQGTCLPYSGPECGACADSCPVPGALQWTDGIRPTIDPDRCTGCALCREACILDHKAIRISARQSDDRAAEAS